MDAIGKNQSALAEALDISVQAVSKGFEWDSLDEVWAQVESEIEELKQAYDLAPKDESGALLPGTPEAREAELELGDVLFSLVNVGRKMGLDAETALHASNGKFVNRWNHMERSASQANTALECCSKEELHRLWGQAKQTEHTSTQEVR